MPSSIEHIGNKKTIFKKIKSFIAPILNGNNGSKLLEQARQLRRQGDLKQAETILNRFIASRPLSVPALTELGLIFEISGRYQEALKSLTKAQELSPKDPFPHIYQVRVLLAERKYQEARLKINQLSKLITINSPAKALVLFGRILRNTGNYTKALYWAEQSFKSGGGEEALELVNLVNGDLNVYSNGFRPTVNYAPKDTQESEDKIFHLLEDSLPYKNSGYTIRSSYILLQQRASGLNVFAATKPGIGKLAEITLEEFNKGQYYRLPLDGHYNYNMHPLDKYLQTYADYVLQICMAERPSIIHAASNFKNGLVANSVASSLGLPWIYEARGIWEASQVAVGAINSDSERYKFFQKLELESMLAANAVVTISETLKRYFIEQGIPESKIFLVPNGVDTESFPVITEPDSVLVEKYNLKDSLTIGYIGSLSHYEGIELLIKAFINVSKNNPKIKLMIVGDGDSFNSVKLLAEESGIADRIILTGRVPHDKILPYYSILDLFVLPRLPFDVCQKVTPLKPYEAMSTGRALLVSDVEALQEMVIEGKTGLTFRAGDVDHLSSKLLNLIEDNATRRSLAAQAASWVRENRTWQKSIAGYKEAYNFAKGSVVSVPE